MKWTMDKCTAVFSAMTEEELEIIDRVHENENELSEIQLLNKVNQCLLSKKDRKENLMEAAVLIIEAANKGGKMKSYKEINTKFFNLHFSVSGKDGKYKPEGLFYCAYEDDYENRLVHLAIDSRKGNLLVYECVDKEQAIERLMIWWRIERNEGDHKS